MAKDELIIKDEENEESTYVADEKLMRISSRFKIAKWITLAVLVLFSVSIYFFNRSEITVENIQYLFSYIQTDSNIYSYTNQYKTISFSSFANSDFGVFREDLVVADSSAVSIYSSSGGSVLYSKEYFSAPKIMSNSGRLIIYDQSGNTFAVYNTFTKLFSGSLDYQITGGAVSESGLYAFISRAAEYKSAVYFYRDDGEYVSRVLKNRFVISVAINEEGSRSYIASIDNAPEEGGYSSEVMICNPSNGDIISTVALEDCMALRVSANKNGFFLFTDKGMYFFSPGGEQKEYVAFSSDPIKIHFDGDYAFVCFSDEIDGSSYSLDVYASSGEKVDSKKFSGRPVSMKYQSGEIFLLTQNSVLRMKMKSSRVAEYKYEGNCLDLCISRGNTLYLCYPGSASSFAIDSILEYTSDFD